MEKLKVKIWQSRLGQKLMFSYLIVIIVGIVTLALAAESVTSTAFNRHMLNMEDMEPMGQMLESERNMQHMATDLFTNFQIAFTETLLIAMVVAIISAVFVSYFVSGRIVTPIQQMMQVSQYIADGHYQIRVDASSNDELGQLANSFNQMAKTLEQTETMRRELIANVTHELRTPLTSIKAYMEGMIDGVLPAEVSTYQQIYREADRLQRLVDDLQELSRIEAKAFKLNLQPLSITTLVQQIATRLLPQFEEKGVHLQLNIKTNSVMLMGDEDYISQILVNLMGNALQYTPSNGTVVLNTTHKDNFIIITIADTGIGIPLEHQPHIFTRFYRVDKSRSRPGGGSGIGLTITKHLVEAHNGYIWVQSSGTGQGSSFSFALPLQQKSNNDKRYSVEVQSEMK